ncbi:hypothetical protein [Streptomyces capuensis]|uniref:hypothetical protein n=1 Tax=Streptomyces capuensis TaxID=1464056 RepID=UPI0004C0CFB6|nr:hypothetical protein [Streptomyces capuensis]
MPERDVEAVIKASNYVQHGTNHWGDSFPECICPKQPCGGVSGDDELDACPEHSRTPNQLWHWAAECPAVTA